jgi:phage shock protein A
MNALTRIFGRVREQLAELGESIAGSQAQRELDEEIRGMDERLREWRASLAAFQANRFTTQERVEAAEAAIAQREAQALASLQAGKHALAREVAAAIVQLEERRDDEIAALSRIDEHIVQMRHLIGQGENGLRRLQQQLDTLRAAETVQRAQESVVGRQPGIARPQTAIESLLRARRRAPAPEMFADGLGAVDDPELDARLAAEGIDGRDARIQFVLDRVGQRLIETSRPGGRRAKPRATPGNSR